MKEWNKNDARIRNLRPQVRRMIEEEVFAQDLDKIPSFRPLGGYTLFYWKAEILPYLQRVGFIEAPLEGWAKIIPYEGK